LTRRGRRLALIAAALAVVGGAAGLDRVLVGYIEIGNRGSGSQIRLSNLQPAQRTTQECEAAATIDDHAGGGETNAGGSASETAVRPRAPRSSAIRCDIFHTSPQ
jgi:hypothetical protein